MSLSALSSRLFRAVAPLMFVAAVALIGCERPQEKVIDIEAPGVDIEVKKDRDGSGGTVDVEAGESSERIEIEN